MRAWILEREQHGHYHQLLPLLRVQDPDTYRYYLRVDHDLFTEILQRITPHIEKQNTNWKKALEPGLRLAITLRFLATGEAYKSLAINFRVGGNTISKIVPETCEAIITEYLKETIVCPSTPAGWKRVAEEFAGLWDFHHAIGALDGKHIAIQPPPQHWFLLLQLQGVPLYCTSSPRGRPMQVHVHRCGGQWVLFRCRSVRGLPPSSCYGKLFSRAARQGTTTWRQSSSTVLYRW